MNNEIDEELSFEDDVAPVNDKAEETTAPATAESAPTANAKAVETPAPAESIKPEAAPAPPAKRSRTGMAVAAGFAVCILASSISAIQAWRAASMTAHNNDDASTKMLEARLN